MKKIATYGLMLLLTLFLVGCENSMTKDKVDLSNAESIMKKRLNQKYGIKFEVKNIKRETDPDGMPFSTSYWYEGTANIVGDENLEFKVSVSRDALESDSYAGNLKKGKFEKKVDHIMKQNKYFKDYKIRTEIFATNKTLTSEDDLKKYIEEGIFHADVEVEYSEKPVINKELISQIISIARAFYDEGLPACLNISYKGINYGSFGSVSTELELESREDAIHEMAILLDKEDYELEEEIEQND
ncbi:hypothetical protein lbkm_2719 [Lachnospiraceae bacterium KM106-2]|nr:hypothetical protein lbkm_2719 [Lachnospiraceae bacterium KM106-2]